MNFTTTENNTKPKTVSLQNALDQDANRVAGTTAVLELAPTSFTSDTDPTVPLFGRRTTSKARTFQVDLMAGWSRA